MTEYKTVNVQADSKEHDAIKRVMDDHEAIESYSAAARYLIREGAQKVIAGDEQ